MKASDFQNIDFQNIGSWPAPVKSVFCVVLFVLLLLGGWYVSISGQQEALERAEQKEEALKKDFSEKQKKAVQLEPLKKLLNNMQGKLCAAVKKLPNETEMPKVLEAISQTALGAGIQVELFQPGTETPKDFYAEKPISLRMVGTYQQFSKFIDDTTKLTRALVLTMNDISLKPVGKDKKIDVENSEGQLTLEGSVKTYRYLEEGKGPCSSVSTSEQINSVPVDKGEK